MSFLPLNEQENEQPSGAPAGGAGGATPPETPTSSGSAGAETAGGGAKTSAGGTPTQFGSSASKLGDYLKANAPQVGQQAQSVAGKFNNQYGQLQQGIQNAANQFGQQVQGGYAANNPDVVKQAITNPTQFTMNPESVKAFQNQYNDQYTGPQNFIGTQGYGDIQGQVNTAQQQANLLGTQAGLQSYLQGQGKNPTPASSTLDALLLRGNPNAQKTIQDAMTQFGGLTGQLGSATELANKSVADAQKAAADAQTYARGQFDPYVQDFGNQLTTGAQQAETQRGNYNAQLNKYLADIQPLVQQANIFSGVFGNANSGFGNVNNPYSTQNQITNPITLDQYATPEQYAQAAALQQLSGNTWQSPLNMANVNQAGKAPAIPQISNLGASGLAQEYANAMAQNSGLMNPNSFTGTLPTGSNWGAVGTAEKTLLDYLKKINPNAVGTKKTGPPGHPTEQPIPIYNPIGV